MMKRRFPGILALTLLLLCLVSSHVLADEHVELRLYYSPDCSHCQAFREQYLPQIIAEAGESLIVIQVDVSDASGLAELEAQEARLGQTAADVPVVVIGDTLLYAEDIAELDRLVRATIGTAASSTGDTLAPLPLMPPATLAGGAPVGEPLWVAYVERDGCSECARARLVLDALAPEFPNMQIETFNHVADAALVEAMGESMGLAQDRRLIAPSIYVGDTAVVDNEITTESVRSALAQYQAAGAPAFWRELDTRAGSNSIINRFEQLGPIAVAGAGLIDGINPCAFATILFFMSYLAIGKRKRRDMLLVGLAFTIGVFITYYLVGLGLMSLMSLASTVHVVAYALYGLMAAACVVMAVLSARDYALARQGRLHDMQMTLPDRLRQKIHLRIRKSSRAFAGAALVTGVVVSLLELACTGQVYLPTISYVVGLDGLRTAGMLYLLLYNVAFVLPLLIVLGLAIYGTSTQSLRRWFTEHVAASKLVMTFLFVGLAALLIVQLLALA